MTIDEMRKEPSMYERYAIDDEIVIFSLDLEPEKYAFSEQKGRVHKLDDRVPRAKVEISPGVMGSRALPKPMCLCDDRKGDTISLVVVAPDRAEEIDEALTMIGGRVDELCSVYLSAFRDLIKRRGMRTAEVPQAEVGLATELLSVATRFVRPVTNKIVHLPAGLSEDLLVRYLVDEVEMVLVEEGFNGMRERFVETAKDLMSLFPMVILASNYVKVELENLQPTC